MEDEGSHGDDDQPKPKKDEAKHGLKEPRDENDDENDDENEQRC